MGRPINVDVIAQHLGEVMRIAASIQDGSLKPSSMLRKLGAQRQRNLLYLAFGEISRIERAPFMLDGITNLVLRMESQAGLNKGEFPSFAGRCHVCPFARAYSWQVTHHPGKRVIALNLVIAAIIF